MKYLINLGVQNPKSVFIADALGALLTAASLLYILPHFSQLTGIPDRSLYLLSTFPLGFAIFDLYTLIKPLHLQKRLFTISNLNIAYCITSLIIAISNASSLLLLGWVYIIGEIFLVAFIAIIERNIAARI